MTITKMLIIVSSIGALVWAAISLFSSVTGQVGVEIPPTLAVLSDLPKAEKLCGIKSNKWRVKREIDGVLVSASTRCIPDNPWEVAAFVKGTNNVSMQTLMSTRLASDAVIKENDRDGDGDPDVIHIRLEVAELNGSSPDGELFLPTYEIAPGVTPGLWVFAPKTRGMAAINLYSYAAIPELRAPSPVIRVEQGDSVMITLENTHYFPHTIHLHGVDHPYLDAQGRGNDGVPLTAEHPVMPGETRTYSLKPRQTGTMFYHCHVQTDKHLMMGLQGMFVVEENRPNNWLQTMNIGAGLVRHSSVAVKESFDLEYDLHYQNIDKELNSSIQSANDPRLIAKQMNRVYDMTDATADYFLLNGHSFPFTLRDSLIVADPDQHIKLRIVNGQSEVLALHTHGHKATITHYDGIEIPQAAQITRDVVMLGPAQRADLNLSTTDDGLHSYGPGVWLFHNHAEKGITTDGRGPGGDISLIVYRSFLEADGMPKLQGVDIARFIEPEYYAGDRSVWGRSSAAQLLGEAALVQPGLIWLIAFGVVVGLILGLLLWLLAGNKALGADR